MSWTEVPLKQVASAKGRIGYENLRSDEFVDEGPFLVTGMHFQAGGVDWHSCYHITEQRWQMAPEIQLRDDDILITKDGTIGKVAHVKTLPGRASLNSHLLVVRPLTNQLWPRFLYYVLLSTKFQNYAAQQQQGSTFGGLSEAAFRKFMVPLPSVPTQQAIAEYLDREVASLDTVIEKKQQSIALLREFRQSLVTAAVTGSLDSHGAA
jgi:type I restriction enzyme S subunit